MNDSLIGHTGFVGTTLQKQHPFSACFNSSTIGNIDGGTFDTVVCCAAPAQKWIANREPEADLVKIEGLIRHLETIRCTTFILISTVDVFKDSCGADEETPVDEAGLHPYGLHRRRLEKFVQEHFPQHLVVRLPGLVGPGLRKNVIFDFRNTNNLHAIDSRGVFQFYPMVNLWSDITVALRAGLKLLHLTAEPVSVAEVAEEGFGLPFRQELPQTPARYDFQSRHGELFGGCGHYQYSRRETLLAVRAYAQSEPVTLTAEGGH